jgi:hypothetical protein
MNTIVGRGDLADIMRYPLRIAYLSSNVILCLRQCTILVAWFAAAITLLDDLK